MNKIKAMSKRDQMKVARSVEEAIELSNEGLEPSVAIAKVAAANDYNPEVIKRMCEAFNSSKLLAVYKQAEGPARAGSVSTAHPDEVIKQVFGDKPTPREKSSTQKAASYINPLKPLGRTYLKPVPVMEKAAGEKTKKERVLGDPNLACKKAADSLDVYRIEMDSLRREKHAAEEKYKKALGAIYDFFRSRPGNIQKYAEYEGKIASKFGENGWKFMTIVHKTLNVPNVKRASSRPAKIYDNNKAEPFCYVQDGLDALRSAIDVVEKIASVEAEKEALYNEVFPKSAGSGALAKRDSFRSDAVSPQDQEKIIDVKARVLDSQAESKDKETKNKGGGRTTVRVPPVDVVKSIKLPTLLPNLFLEQQKKLTTPDVELPALDALKTKANVELVMHDLMVNDEVIRKYEPEEVIGVANQILQFSPWIAYNPMGMRAILRKALEQGGMLESYDIKQEIDAGRALKGMRSEERIADRRAIND